MPSIRIEIDEQQEAKIAACIRDRKDFRIEGGEVSHEGTTATLRGVTFEFVSLLAEAQP